jgi:hypothetical protein
MNAAHLHLILNHLPVLGEIGGVVLLAAGLAKRTAAVVRLALLAIVATGVLAVPVFVSGLSAAESVGRVDGVVQEAIAPHEDAAAAFLSGAITAGVLAAITLATSRRWIMPFALTASLIASLLGVRAAILGGRIHHPEIGGSSIAKSFEKTSLRRVATPRARFRPGP